MQAQTSKTVSVEESAKRANTIGYVFFSALMTLPLLGMLIGAFLAIRTVAIIFTRSGQLAKDLTLAAVTIAVGFLGMAATLWAMTLGHGVLALIMDFALNYGILRGVVFGRLAHIYAAPGAQAQAAKERP